jgi:hypothetical protein
MYVKFWTKNLNERGHLGDLGVNKNIIFKRIVELCGLGSLAENKDQQPLASQENVCSLELLN